LHAADWVWGQFEISSATVFKTFMYGLETGLGIIDSLAATFAEARCQRDWFTGN
jgi:hypothetical protein